jgi:hypothetical protein
LKRELNLLENVQDTEDAEEETSNVNNDDSKE